MHERHVDEGAQQWRRDAIEAPRYRLVGDAKRHGVARKGARRSAPDIARELVEKENERQRAFRFAAPFIKRARHRRIRRMREAARDQRVEIGVFSEPSAATGLAPEGDDIAPSRAMAAGGREARLN